MSTMTIMTTVTLATMMTIDHGNYDDHEKIGGYMRKLEVVHKEVGVCLIHITFNLFV